VADLVDLVVDDPRTTSCLTERFFGFAAAHEPSGSLESSVIDGMTDELREHRSFNALVLDVVTSDAFRFLQPPP